MIRCVVAASGPRPRCVKRRLTVVALSERLAHRTRLAGFGRTTARNAAAYCVAKSGISPGQRAYKPVQDMPEAIYGSVSVVPGGPGWAHRLPLVHLPHHRQSGELTGRRPVIHRRRSDSDWSARLTWRGAIRGAISNVIGSTTFTKNLSDLEPPYGIEP